MSSSASFCGICDIRHISKPSEAWCPECEEGLCTECLDHHSLAKPCRTHTTIPIAHYQKLPSYVLESKEYCSEHHEKLILYCKDHGCPCCGICIVETHSDCLDVAILENIVKDVKSSDIFNEIEQLIREMTKTIDKIRQNRETNLSVVKEQKRMIENEIQEMRIKINAHVDKLQENLLKKLTEAEQLVTDKSRELLVSLDKKQNELTEYKTNIVNIKMYASDLQTFVAIKHIQNDVETHDTSLHALVNSHSLNQTILSYNIDSDLKTIVTCVQKFGEVVIESKPCELTFVRKKDKQAHMMLVDLPPPMSVENIQLILKRKVNTKGRNIRGCSLLPDGKMVLSCYNTDTVSFFNRKGVELFQIGKDKTRCCAFDTVYFKDTNSVAVSSGWGDNLCIALIGIESKVVTTIISTDTAIDGMAIRDRTIYYCARNKGLKMINLSDKSVSDIINSNMSGVYYVAISGNRLYYTNYRTHTVTCCDLHGTAQWEFKDERVLQSPRGISVDNNGNVYVVGHVSSNVVVFSPDGQQNRQLLSSKDGLISPHVLDYDKSTNRLLVVNNSTTAFLFDVTVGL